MLGCTVIGYHRPCSPVTGGVSNLWIGDSNDFVFTEGALVAGLKTGYSSIALRSGADPHAAYLFPIDSLQDNISVDITNSNPDGSVSAWDYVIAARLTQMSQALTNFNEKIDSAASCCQLLFVWEMNDGTIFVCGEKYVGSIRIPNFRFRQDGSKISTGKKFTDYNGQDLSLKGTYSRPPYVFTGGITVITGHEPTS